MCQNLKFSDPIVSKPDCVRTRMGQKLVHHDKRLQSKKRKKYWNTETISIQNYGSMHDFIKKLFHLSP